LAHALGVERRHDAWAEAHPTKWIVIRNAVKA
jgi:hypothetical protein